MMTPADLARQLARVHPEYFPQAELFTAIGYSDAMSEDERERLAARVDAGLLDDQLHDAIETFADRLGMTLDGIESMWVKRAVVRQLWNGPFDLHEFSRGLSCEIQERLGQRVDEFWAEVERSLQAA